MGKVSDAQKAANKKWADKNRDRIRYLRQRTEARSFIRKRATLQDLDELADMIIKRKQGKDI